jgi:hypothetical protein
MASERTDCVHTDTHTPTHQTTTTTRSENPLSMAKKREDLTHNLPIRSFAPTWSNVRDRRRRAVLVDVDKAMELGSVTSRGGVDVSSQVKQGGSGAAVRGSGVL